jgi:hypothetical protein
VLVNVLGVVGDLKIPQSVFVFFSARIEPPCSGTDNGLGNLQNTSY